MTSFIEKHPILYHAIVCGVALAVWLWFCSEVPV